MKNYHSGFLGAIFASICDWHDPLQNRYLTEKKLVSEWSPCFAGDFTRTVVSLLLVITCDWVLQFKFHTLLSLSYNRIFACTEMEYCELELSWKHHFQKWKVRPVLVALVAAKMRSWMNVGQLHQWFQSYKRFFQIERALTSYCLSVCLSIKYCSLSGC